MTNWNSKSSEYTPIKKRKTIEQARIAIKLYTNGHSVAYISEHMQLSKSRIYEYIRKDFIAPPKPPTRQFHI